MLDMVISATHNNHKRETSLTGVICVPVRETSTSNKSKMGKKLGDKKGNIPNLVEATGYPRESMSKRSTCPHPAFDPSRSPAIQPRKGRKTLFYMVARGRWRSKNMGGRKTPQSGYDLESINGVYARVPVGEKQCARSSQCFWEAYPFTSIYQTKATTEIPPVG